MRQVIDGVAGDTQELVFPLAAGTKRKSVTMHRNLGTKTLVAFEVERTVVGVERVKTAAGEFDGFKIAGKGRWILKEDPLKAAVTDSMAAWNQPSGSLRQPRITSLSSAAASRKVTSPTGPAPS